MRKWMMVVGLTLALLLGCGGNPTPPPVSQPAAAASSATAYKILMTDKQLYDTTFKTLAALDQQGKLPAAAKEKAIRLGNLYLLAHNQAVQSLSADKTPDLNAVSTALDAFLTVAAPYIRGN